MGTLILGVPIVAALALTGVVLASQRRLRRPAFGFIAGFGASLLYVAWLNRAGPGTTCWQTATATGCDQHLNPLPWLLVGGLLFLGAIVAYARRGS